jgi:flagellar protein FliO/FliZ
MSSRTARSIWKRAAFFLLLPVSAFAAGPDSGTPDLQAPVGSGDILSVAASLILVVAAIVLCGWLYSRSQGLRIRSGGIINIIATQPLGPKERILLIEVADKQLVVGMTSTQVSTLHVFDEPVLRSQPDPDQRSNFGERLRSILRGDAR